jgi:hypothetical protein
MAGAGGMVRNTPAKRVRWPSRISQRADRCGSFVGVVWSMPFFLPQGGCPTPSDVVGTARKGAYD